MLTFSDIQTRVLRWLDEAEATGAHTTARVKDAINAVHRRIYYSRKWPWTLYPLELSFTTVAGQKTYALNPSIGRVLSIWDRNASQWAALIPRREWEALGVNPDTTNASSLGWSLGPVWPVSVQPSAAATISLVSSSAADVAGTSCQVFLSGLVDGVMLSEIVVMTGTTPAVSTLSYSHLFEVSKSGTWAGTLTASASAVTLLTLTSGETARHYPTLTTQEAPVGGLVFPYTAQRRCRTLVEDEDIPEIKPNEHAEILVYETLIEEATYNSEIPTTSVSLWKKRADEIMLQLDQAAKEDGMGSYPRFVRDLGGSSIRAVVTA